MHDYFFIKRISLLELLAIVVILVILAAVLIPVVSNIIDNAREQVDIAHMPGCCWWQQPSPSVWMVWAMVSIRPMKTVLLHGHTTTCWGRYGPVSQIGLDYLIVDVDFSRDAADVIRICRVVKGVVQVYRTGSSDFE